MFKIGTKLIKEEDTLDGNINVYFMDSSARPIFLSDYFAVFPSKDDPSIKSHHSLASVIENAIKYDVSLESMGLVFIGNRKKFYREIENADSVTSLLLDNLEKIKNCRVWIDEEIFSTWSSVEAFKKGDFEMVKKIIEWLGSSVGRYRYYSSVSVAGYLDRTDLMTWEEFTNFDPNYLEEREKAARRKLADAKRMAHLMSGPYKNRMVGLESNNLLTESPDAAVSQSGNYTASWRDDGCITLIINGKGDVAYSDYPAMSHNKMADIIFINHYTERNDLDDEAEYDFEDKLNSIKYLKNASRIEGEIIAARIKSNGRIRSSMGDFAIGRIFQYAQIVSFWNTIRGVSEHQLNMLFLLMEKLGLDPEEFVYEFTSPIFNPIVSEHVIRIKGAKELLRVSEEMGKHEHILRRAEDLNDDELAELQRQAHIEPDPIKRNAIKKKIGMDKAKGKAPIPLDVKYALNREQAEIIAESPDEVEDRENGLVYKFHNENNFTFIGNKDGDIMYFRHLTHGDLQSKLCFYMGSSNTKDYIDVDDFIKWMRDSYKVDLFVIGNGNKLLKDIVDYSECGDTGFARLHLRLLLNKFILGRVFVDAGVVSFWNEYSDMRRKPQKAILKMLEDLEFSPNEFKYEFYSEDRDDFFMRSYRETFLFPSIASVSASKSISPKQAQMHVEPDPIKRQALRNELGLARPRGKNIPIDVRYALNRESSDLLSESPDLLTYDTPRGEKTVSWSHDPHNITFVMSNDGDALFSRGTTHYFIGSRVEDFISENEFDIMSRDDYDVVFKERYNFKSIGDCKKLMGLIHDIISKADSPSKREIRLYLQHFILGRVFLEPKVVSFWNKKTQLTTTIKESIIRMMEDSGLNPEEFTYEFFDYSEKDFIKIPFNIFFYKNPSTPKKDKPKNYKIHPLQAQMHVEPDPIKRNILRKELGMDKVKAKRPLDLEYKRLMNQEGIQYHAFDWDDNLLYMPTKILMESEDGSVVKLTTKEYAEFRKTNSIIKEGKAVSKLLENSFNGFREENDDMFLTECLTAEAGPAWNLFVEAINNGRIFSIITARGHRPRTIADAVMYMIEANFKGISKIKCLNSLKMFHESSDSDKEFTEDELLERYVYNLCKYYPVYFLSKGAGLSIEKEKLKYLKEFRQYVEDKFEGMSLEFKNNVSNSFVIDYSDDDIINLNYVKENSKFDSKLKELIILSTNNGTIVEH